MDKINEETKENLEASGKTKKLNKYEQFRKDLVQAIIESNRSAASVNSRLRGRQLYDCNFYSCMIQLPRWRSAKVIEICEDLGVFAQKYNEGGWWSISPSHICGIGSGRMAAARTMVAVMASKGYNVSLDSTMD